MRILVTAQYFYPDPFRISSLVQDLAARGHQITVLTGQPDYATGTVPAEYKWFRKHHEYIGMVEVFRCPIIARRQGPIWRFFNYLSYMITGSLFAWLHKFKPFDVIYVWGVSPITAAVPAILLKKCYKKPLFFYCLDLWPESMKAMKVGETNPVFKTVALFTRWIYRQFDHVAVTSKPFIEYIYTVNKYPLDKITYLPQYGADHYLEKDFSSPNNGTVDFLFAGNVGHAQAIDKIIEATAMIQDIPNFQVHIVGDGSAKQQFENLVKKLHLTHKIRFYGRVKPEEMERYYQLADACLLTLDGSSKIGDTLPGKMQGYMAAGKPVLAAINGAGKEVVEESRCGLAVAAGDVAGLAHIMKEFVQNPAKYAACGENGRTYFKGHFTKAQHLMKLDSMLRELVFNSSPKGDKLYAP